MSFKHFVTFLLFPVTVFSQQKSTITGYLGIEGGELFTYKIYFTELEGKITGKATTWLEPGKEVCAKIEGTIDKKNRIFSFVEKEILYNTGFSSVKTICLIKAQLKFDKDDNNNLILSGRITSTDVTNVSCARGFISFTNSMETLPLFEIEKPKETTAILKPYIKKNFTVKTEEKENNSTQISPKSSIVKPYRIVNETPFVYPVKSTTKTKNSFPEKVTSGQDITYNWKTDSLSIEIWDNSRVDGDVITLLYNGKKILENYSLVKEKKLMRLPFEKEENELSIIAVNEGSEQPNTADIVLYDGKEIHSVISYNSIGKKSIIRILKSKK